MNVSRPVLPWHWTGVLLMPLEVLAVAWSIPFIILFVGIPLVLVVALIDWIGRFAANLF